MRYLLIVSMILLICSCQLSGKKIGQEENNNYKKLEEGFISTGDEGSFSSEEGQTNSGSTVDNIDILQSNSADV